MKFAGGANRSKVSDDLSFGWLAMLNGEPITSFEIGSADRTGFAGLICVHRG